MTLQTQTAVSILQIVPLIMRIVASELRREEVGLVPPQLAVLNFLREQPRNLSELAELSAVSLPTMSGTVNKLVKDGYVERHRSAIDRRVIQLTLSEKGLEALTGIGEKIAHRLSLRLIQASEAEMTQIINGLTLLAQRIAPDEDETST